MSSSTEVTTTSSQSSKQWIVPSVSKALFCPDCGSILELPDVNDNSKCYDCPYVLKNVSAQNFVQVQVKTYATEADSKAAAVDPTMRRATVEEPCPKCEYPQLRFYTLQMRSVDEGQTVFYECEKCGYTTFTNT